jgi:hypothetical protein
MTGWNGKRFVKSWSSNLKFVRHLVTTISSAMKLPFVFWKVKKLTVRIWRTEHSHITMQVIGDSPENQRVLCCVKNESVWPLLLCRSYCHWYNITRHARTMVADLDKGRFTEESPLQTGWSSALLSYGCEGLLERKPAGGLKRRSTTHSLAPPPLHSRTTVPATSTCGHMWRTRYSSTSDDSRANFTGHIQSQWNTVEAYMGRIWT